MAKKCEACGQKLYSERSLNQSRYYWKLITFLWLHQKDRVWQKPYNLHQTIKLFIGHTEPVLNSKGEKVGIALRPTNFKDMSQDKFNEYFNDVQDFIWERIVPMHDEEFEKELSQLLRMFQ